ncbi:hypothetical protein BH11ACT4_BH11ACT4_13140 [soil metagenome]
MSAHGSVRLYVVVGTPGSGKDLLVRAVRNLGETHAGVVPKHTSRERRWDDGDEMVCIDDAGYDLDSCQLIYGNYKSRYGVRTDLVWAGLRRGVSQVLVVSSPGAIRELITEFDSFITLVYVHSILDESDLEEIARNTDDLNSPYYQERRDNYWDAFDFYEQNVTAFDHVLIHAGPNEDLYDQIFRLFRAYERGLV